MNRVSQFGWSQGFNALNYQHEQFENAACEYRAAAEEPATARVAAQTVAQIAARLQSIDFDVEADFLGLQRMFISEIHCESMQALEAQRGALVREVAEEVCRRNAFNNEIVFRLRDELINTDYMLNHNKANLYFLKVELGVVPQRGKQVS